VKPAIVVGTRPEIIKMSPIVRECQRRGIEFVLIHSGQHFSYNMDHIFFEDLKLPEPKYKLEIGERYKMHGEQTGEMLKHLEGVLVKERIDVVLVEGDTNTVLAGALASVKLHIPVGHVEAGLRSFDRNMPEELNRILTDHCSDILFAPTEIARGNLLNEGIPDKRIFVTGNTIVDAVYQNIEIAKQESTVLRGVKLKPREYILITVHRPENVDDRNRLGSIIDALFNIQFPILFPIHPRTKKMAEHFGLLDRLGSNSKKTLLSEPVGYLDFLLLLANARLVLTDSGGVQEEACILKVPCLTLRDNTERPESIEVGGNYLVGTSPAKIASYADRILSDADFERHMRNTVNPFGDGKAAKKIVASAEQLIKGGTDENTGNS